MKIAIIGAGNVGTALAAGWIRSGHQIVFGVRDQISPKTADAMREFPDARAIPILEAIDWAETVVISTPAQGIDEILPHLQNLSDTTIIDTTNTINAAGAKYPTVYHAIKAQTSAAHVVKCFNSTGFENMRNPIYANMGIDMFAAGDSAHAKQIASGLASDLGFAHCHDFGGDDKVELLEKLALCWINLAIMQGMGRNIAFRLVSR
jgi:predicted dinucleotide-binding enzyme